MQHPQNASEHGLRGYKLVLWLLLSPLWLPLLALVMVLFFLLHGPSALWTALMNYRRELRLTRQMRACGRFVSRRHFQQQLDSQNGTLLIEEPTLGWAVSRAWWTSDDVIASSPFAPPDEEVQSSQALNHPFEDWCYRQYTHPRNGKALLLKAWNGKRFVDRLKLRSDSIRIVPVWTGPAIEGMEVAST